VGPHQNRLGTFVAESRRALGFSRTDLAKHLGISYAYLGHIESGRRPISDRVEKPLGKALGLHDGLMHDLVSAVYASDDTDNKNDWLEPLLHEAVAEVRAQLESPWVILAYDGIRPTLLLTSVREYEVDSQGTIALPPNTVDTRTWSEGERASLIGSLVGSLSREQAQQLIELLQASLSSESAPGR